MATLIWIKAMVKSLAAVGSSLSILIYKRKNNFFSIDAADANPFSLTERSTPWNSNWDKREPECLLAYSGGNVKIPVVERNIFLIRHGMYKESHGKLTKKGKKQARLTGEKLKEMAYPYNPTIYTSTMTRAIQTSQIIKTVIPHLRFNKIRILCEGIPTTCRTSVLPEVVQRDRERIGKAFEQFFYRANPEQTQDSFEIIVCHANVIRYFVYRALQLPLEASMRFALNHGSITWLVIHPDGHVRLKLLGDSTFMRAAMITS